MGMTITSIYGDLGIAAGMVAVLVVLLWVCDYFEERRDREELERLMEAAEKKKSGQRHEGQNLVGGKEGEVPVNTDGYNAESESLTMPRDDEPRAKVQGVCVGSGVIAEKETRDAEWLMGCVRGMQVS